MCPATVDTAARHVCSQRARLREVLATATQTSGRIVACFQTVSEALTPVALGNFAGPAVGIDANVDPQQPFKTEEALD